ncbi:unannotated protein [freshwater metagenome]|uniref:Unannotated protein n=1 Tax=freshwater metagenome TaxID=449393 RepID=A0A6J6ZRC7_9ZZZZ
MVLDSQNFTAIFLFIGRGVLREVQISNSSQVRGRLPKQDLLDIIESSHTLLTDLKSANILVSGGSGFIGKWLVSTLLEANEVMNLGLNVVVLTRDSQAASSKLGAHKSDPLHFIQSDFSNSDTLEYPKNIFFTHIVHGAISTTKSYGDTSSEDLIKSSKNGANALIERASFQGNKPVLMHLSSGAVYGPQPLTLPRIPSDRVLGTGNEVISDYALVKINTETLVREAHEKAIIRGANPRLFSFFGPHVPIDQQFAIGNFIQDVILNRDITVSGNPQTSRSYLYPTDLMHTLLVILTKPTIDDIQVGSSRITTMGELATLISNQFGRKGINYSNPNSLESRYVPEMDCYEKSYKFEQKISLEEGLARWRRWLDF